MQPPTHNPFLLLVGDAERRNTIKQGLAGSEITLAGEIFQSEALRLVPRLQPDVVVLDLAASEINSLVALRWLSTLPSAPRIIAIGVAGSLTEEQFAIELGADAYAMLDKPGSINGALRSVMNRKVPAGQSWLNHVA